MTLSDRGESSLSSDNFNPTPKWKFDVFLSFAGKDTRLNFTDHLYVALCKKGIITFRDDEGLERGKVISQQLLKVIEDSLCAIVVLSKSYAFSTWCLDELQKILEVRKELGRLVFPIFYGIEPSDVRHQRGSFEEALAKHDERFKDSKDKEKVQRWRNALTEVADISGWDSKDRHEADFIEKIAGKIWTHLCSKLPSYNDNLVGIDSRIAEINSQLGIGLDDICFVGIWGMGGIGKTTLARAIYKRFSSQFDTCCFLANVREVSEKNGQAQIQGKLISLLKRSSMVIGDTDEGKEIIKKLCFNKKILLVLDDVNHISQLENLAESPEWFGAGSRVIITTRDMHLLKSHGVHRIYEIETMKNDESLQLLSKKAFKKDHPEEGYLELSETVVQYAGGLPLALQVLGSFLCGRSVPEWEDALAKLKQIPNYNILQTLKISYDALDDEEKTIFLDIACFFKGWEKYEVTEVLKNCGLHSTIGLSCLIEKSLLIEHGKFLEMHDLLQELGRRIIFQESPNNACKRSRLWSSEDIDQVLKYNMGTEAIQAMVLSWQLAYEARWDSETRWDSEAFSKMCNLRLLIVRFSVLNISRGLKSLSGALKVIQWPGYPLQALPLETPLVQLVDIQMQHSNIKQLWNGIQCLGKLKFIDLSYSKYLIETPNFSGVPNLERLILDGCTSLVEVHPSLGELKKLVLVNLARCKSLKILPEFGKCMKNLLLLDLEDTAITELPKSLGFLIGLGDLKLKGCKNLACLPHTFHKLKYLKTLNISGCSKFLKLPENLKENEALENLNVSRTSIKEVSSSIFQLRNLKILSFYRCKGLSCSSWSLGHIMGLDLTSLTELNLSYCGIDDGSIPDDFGCLSSLLVLDLGGNNFINLPAGCISNLLRLHYLFLNSCPRLKSLPRLPPRLICLDATDCASMEPLLRDEKLWYLFSSLDHQHRHRTKYLGTPLKDIESEYLPCRDFIATIPGSEIPSWFPNKVHSFPVTSIIVDIPQSCRPSEWSGIAVCLNILYPSGEFCISWTSKAPVDDNYIRKRWGHAVKCVGGDPHLCLMLLHCNDKTCWQYLGGDNNQLQIKFSATNAIIKECGWRVLCKEDMEEWCKANDFNKLSVAEVGTSEVWVPESLLRELYNSLKCRPNQTEKEKEKNRFVYPLGSDGKVFVER